MCLAFLTTAFPRETLILKGGEKMKQEAYIKVTGLIFSVITILHVLRLIFGWDAVLGGWQVPVWLSFIAVALGGFLAYSAFKFSK